MGLCGGLEVTLEHDKTFYNKKQKENTGSKKFHGREFNRNRETIRT